jgi:phosphatidylserine decarboxylase
MKNKAIMPPCWPIAKEGYLFLFIAIGITLALTFLLGKVVGIISLGLPIYVACFFRNPERKIPAGEGFVISPADGRILSVEDVEEGRYLHKRLRRVCIFMSLINVHINRMPMSGKVRSVHYNPGKFLIGFSEKASLDNEQNAIVMESSPVGGKVREILFVQIAGFIARRIVCYVTGGESVAKGERFGLIRFGSRVDVYLPLDCEILVKEGEKVKGGETVLGRFS